MLFFSISVKKPGRNGSNFSLFTLEAFLAAVPEIPAFLVTITLSSILGYLSTDLVLLAISAKSLSSFSLAPNTHSTSFSGFSFAKLYISWIGGFVALIILTLFGK